MTKLKPCPFCSGKADWHCFLLDYPTKNVRAYVQCNACDAEICRDGRVNDTKKIITGSNNRMEQEG